MYKIDKWWGPTHSTGNSTQSSVVTYMRRNTPLQCSCLENPMDGGAWWAAVHGVAKSQTWLSDWAHRHGNCLVPGVETWARKLKQGFYILALVHGGCVIMSHSASASVDLSFLTCEMNIIHRGLVAKLCPTLVTPWTVACQAPLSVGFSRQEYWSGLPFPSPEYLPNPGIVCRQNLYQLSYEGPNL